MGETIGHRLGLDVQEGMEMQGPPAAASTDKMDVPVGNECEPWVTQAQMLKNPREVQEGQVPSLGGDRPLEGGVTTHSSILTWRIPWTQEPGGPQSMGYRESETTERISLWVMQDIDTSPKDSKGKREPWRTRKTADML